MMIGPEGHKRPEGTWRSGDWLTKTYGVTLDDVDRAVAAGILFRWRSFSAFFDTRDRPGARFASHHIKDVEAWAALCAEVRLRGTLFGERLAQAMFNRHLGRR